MLDAKQMEHGEYGESLIIDYFTTKNWEHSGPYMKNGAIAEAGVAHDFDHAFKSKRNNKFFFADSKAKAKRTKYHDTGINKNHFIDYFKLFLENEKTTARPIH